MAHGTVPTVGAGPPGVDWSVTTLASGAWTARPEVVVPLLIAGGLYAVGWWRLSRRGATVSVPRLAAAVGGLASVAVALLSPLDRAAHGVFAAHMLQHLLLISVAAPLLLLADPFAAVIWGLPSRVRRAAGRLFRPATRLRRAWRGLTAMPVAWALHVLAVWLWHLPIAYDAAVADRVLHDLEHVVFFASAVIFWWPVVQPAPGQRRRTAHGARVVYLVLAAFQGAFLGLLLSLSPRAWYRSYVDTADQAMGGLIMWGVGGAIDMLAVLILVGRYLDSEDLAGADLAAPPRTQE
jgi:putative membrane protein